MATLDTPTLCLISGCRLKPGVWTSLAECLSTGAQEADLPDEDRVQDLSLWDAPLLCTTPPNYLKSYLLISF